MNLYALLQSLGYPVGYNHFTETKALPYIIYMETDTDNFGADNKVYSKIQNYSVELYTEKKQKSVESQLENMFESNDIFFDKSEIYISNENMYQITYSIQI